MSSPRLASLLLLLAVAPACAAEAPATPALPPPAPAPTVRMPDFGAQAAEAPAERRVIEIRIAPVAVGPELAHLDVAIRLSEPPGEFAEPGALVLSLPRAEDGDAGWPDAIEEIYARDAEGALPLRARAAPGTEWRSDRRPVGAIGLSYRVRLARSDAGHFHGTRAHARGFEGTGATFLLLPEAADTYRVRLAWDLRGAGEGAVAAASFGAEASATLEKVREAVFMAGPLGRLAVDAGGSRFEGAWLGRAGFEPVEALAWVSRVREAGRSMFHDGDGAPFTALLRAVPGQAWSVTGQPSGVRILAGEETSFGRAARFDLARQVVRRWIGGDAGVRFEGPEAATRWFTEGIAGHFARELLLRSGLATIDEVADELSAPAPPGLLYAAEVDAALRAKSGGKRSLDDLVLGLLARARAGARPGEASTPPLPAASFRDLVGDALGPEGQARFDAAATRGEPVTLPPEAFGPCFKREKNRARPTPGPPAKLGDTPRPPAPPFVWVRDPRAPASCARRAG